MKWVKTFWADETGMETVEWAVMAALIVAGLVTIIHGVGTNVSTRLTRFRDATQ